MWPLPIVRQANVIAWILSLDSDEERDDAFTVYSTVCRLGTFDRMPTFIAMVVGVVTPIVTLCILSLILTPDRLVHSVVATFYFSAVAVVGSLLFTPLFLRGKMSALVTGLTPLILKPSTKELLDQMCKLQSELQLYRGRYLLV